MNEIRFSPPPRQNLDDDNYKDGKEKRLTNRTLKVLGLFFKTIMVLALLVILVLGARYIDPLNKKDQNNINAYTAVFLSNGQVYFGKIAENTENEIVLSNVYYLQVNNSGQIESGTSGSGFNLIKMGNEIHGPTDKIFINKSQVVFYEYLREDSKVVESIKNYK